MTIRVDAAGRTDVGLVRRRNEDSYYVGSWLFAVADGLGGHVAGDIASTTVIDALCAYDGPVDAADLAGTLGQAVGDANRAVRRRIEAEPELAGMGTTLVAMLRSGSSAVLANVGDSRAYLLRESAKDGRGTVQLTEDHTYQHLVADAAHLRHLPPALSRFLDGRPDGRSPDLITREMQPGDRFLLCSDGLTSYVPRKLIDAALTARQEPGDIADRLIGLAIDHGGPDNVTVVVLNVT